MKPKIPERELPTVYRSGISVNWFRQFTLKERLQILLGFNLHVLIRIPTQHSPGKFQPVIAAHTSKHTNPDALLEEQMNNIIDKQQKGKLPHET